MNVDLRTTRVSDMMFPAWRRPLPTSFTFLRSPLCRDATVLGLCGASKGDDRTCRDNDILWLLVMIPPLPSSCKIPRVENDILNKLLQHTQTPSPPHKPTLLISPKHPLNLFVFRIFIIPLTPHLSLTQSSSSIIIH